MIVRLSSPQRLNRLAGLARASLPVLALTILTFGVCSNPLAAQQVPPAGKKSASKPAPASPTVRQPGTRPAQATGPRTLEDLVKRAGAEEFRLPTIDQAKARSAGLRRLDGKHITIYTDVPPSDEVDELPKVFDAAVPLYCDYFGFDKGQVADWKVIGYLVDDKAKFQRAGLFPDDLPPFPNGYTRGGEFWWYDQPSGYYRRHLMIHEGVHAFMYRWLGGAGPPWYTEGMAELLGTHRWADGKLQLAYTPRSKEEVPYWGRVKIVKDEFAAGRGLQLVDILRYSLGAHLKNEAYGWSWAAAEFFDKHPKTREAFRALKDDSQDRSIDFSVRFVGKMKPDWPDVVEDWQLFVANADYGYDVARAALVRNGRKPLPSSGGTATIDAARGWQSTGYEVKAGKSYRIDARGRYTVGKSAKPWISEPDGITLHYFQGHPLGMLRAGVSEIGDTSKVLSPLTQPVWVGASGTFVPAQDGVLYLSINESAAGLGDNEGSLSAKITEQP